jgi:hypothetical protein
VRNWLIEKFWRYLPAEISGTVAAFLAGWVTRLLGGNIALIAFAGTWGENFGFYGYRVIGEARDCYRQANGEGHVKKLWKILRNLIVEFGPSELLDSFVIRPGAMYLGQKYLGHFALGILAGKFAADLVFYLIAGKMHDIRVKHVD